MFVRVLLVAVLFGASGCGGGADDAAPTAAQDTAADAGEQSTAPATEPTAAPEEEGPVEVTGADDIRGVEEQRGTDKVTTTIAFGSYYYAPTYVRVDPGAKITVNLQNEGDSSHTFTVDSAKVDTWLKGGESGKVTLTMPDKGALRFYCDFHSTMAGAFFSEEGQRVRD